MHEKLIKLKDITKTFSTGGVEIRALNGIDLTICSGDYLAISGPSGCGKSTLLSIIGLLDLATFGSYQLMDQEISSTSFKQRCQLRNQHIGFIFQNFNLVGDLNVFQNVELPLIYRGIARGERAEQVNDVLRIVDLEDRASHFPNQLSGGQQQRVAVARALAIKPEIILADEPTGNLDSKQGSNIMDLMDKLNLAGTTICLVTHDPRYVGYAKRQVQMLDGLIVSDGVVVEEQVREVSL